MANFFFCKSSLFGLLLSFFYVSIFYFLLISFPLCTKLHFNFFHLFPCSLFRLVSSFYIQFNALLYFTQGLNLLFLPGNYIHKGPRYCIYYLYNKGIMNNASGNGSKQMYLRRQCFVLSQYFIRVMGFICMCSSEACATFSTLLVFFLWIWLCRGLPQV